MQKPIKRGNSYRITVSYNNERHTVTRDTAKECEQWAARKLLELKAQEAKADDNKAHISFKTLFDLYYDEVGKDMRSEPFIKQQKDSFDKYWDKLADASIHDLTPLHVKNWRDSRLKDVQPATVLRQLNLYSAIFEYAKLELFIIKTNVFKEVGRPDSPDNRNRRISPSEIEQVLVALKYKQGDIPTKPSHYIAWSFLFALETAMRKGEILSITRSNMFDDFVRLPMTKNGTTRDVPLTHNAKALLALITHTNEKLIPHNCNSFRLGWQRALSKTSLNGDLHFHDTRHEAITRLVNIRKLPVEILAKVTGHKDIKTLINTYYNPTASDIAKMLNAA